MPQHKYRECSDPDCFICNGGLASCEICRGAESSLPLECPGQPMDAETKEKVSDGTIDFIGGRWMRRIHMEK